MKYHFYLSLWEDSTVDMAASVSANKGLVQAIVILVFNQCLRSLVRYQVEDSKIRIHAPACNIVYIIFSISCHSELIPFIHSSALRRERGLQFLRSQRCWSKLQFCMLSKFLIFSCSLLFRLLSARFSMKKVTTKRLVGISKLLVLNVVMYIPEMSPVEIVLQAVVFCVTVISVYTCRRVVYQAAR